MVVRSQRTKKRLVRLGTDERAALPLAEEKVLERPPHVLPQLFAVRLEHGPLRAAIDRLFEIREVPAQRHVPPLGIRRQRAIAVDAAVRDDDVDALFGEPLELLVDAASGRGFVRRRPRVRRRRIAARGAGESSSDEDGAVRRVDPLPHGERLLDGCVDQRHAIAHALRVRDQFLGDRRARRGDERDLCGLLQRAQAGGVVVAHDPLDEQALPAVREESTGGGGEVARVAERALELRQARHEHGRVGRPSGGRPDEGGGRRVDSFDRRDAGGDLLDENSRVDLLGHACRSSSIASTVEMPRARRDTRPR